MQPYPYLKVDRILPDETVMRLLPREIAYRFHALPIAKDGDQITVALASPDDESAVDAVKRIFGSPVCIIRADSNEIDHLLDDLWPKTPIRKDILVISSDGESPTFIAAAKSFAEVVDANLEHIHLSRTGKFTDISKVFNQSIPDLVIFQAVHPSRLNEMFPDPVIKEQLKLIPSILIFPPNPCWPLQKILLILPDNRTGGELAIHWVVKLAKNSETNVTVLPILPSIPLCYGSYLNHNLTSLMEGNHPLGMKMRSITEQFSRENIQGRYKLRNGDPLTQIRDEIFAFDPDLIVIPSVQVRGPARWFSSDLVEQLLMSITTPILFTK